MKVVLIARSHNPADKVVDRFDIAIPCAGDGVAADLTPEQVEWLERDPWITVTRKGKAVEPTVVPAAPEAGNGIS